MIWMDLMGNIQTKTSKMERSYNSTGMYENLESLGEEVARREGVAELKDSKIDEILDSMNEAVQVMVDTLRAQEEMLAVLVKNGEKLEQIVSIIRKFPPTHGEAKIRQNDNISEEPKWKESRVCFRCRKPGHIRRDCRIGR